MGIFGFFNKEKKETLDKGLEKTKTSVFDKLARAVAGKSKVDDDVLDNLEEVLITYTLQETIMKVLFQAYDCELPMMRTVNMSMSSGFNSPRVVSVTCSSSLPA